MERSSGDREDIDGDRGTDHRLILPPQTNKILFKASVTTGLWLEPTYFLEIFFEWSHEIIDIFTDEYLEYEITSFF